MTTPFVSRHRLRFAHCDPAGIAYYPRYLELCDAAVEDWTEQVLGVPRRKLHLDLGFALPTVDLHATFSEVSRLGDWLDFAVDVGKVGRTSVDLAVGVKCAGQLRFHVALKQVLVDLKQMKSIPWPPLWQQRLITAQSNEVEVK